MLVDERGAVVATAPRDYPLHTPHAAWAEQDPADGWRATCEFVGSVLEAASAAPADASG